jgi:hypothetical protein
MQDWQGWLQAGYIDWALPMAYFSQSDPTTRDWYNNWVDWIKANRTSRPVAVGVGAWLNSADGNIAQLRRAADDGVLLGTSLYSYAIPVEGDRGAFLDRLKRELWSDGAPAPTFDWKTQPQTGYVLGRVTQDGAALPNASIHLVGPGGADRWVNSDGSGVFGDVNLAPGSWRVGVKVGDGERSTVVEVAPGRVAHVALEGSGSTPSPAPSPNETPVRADADRAFGELWNRTDQPVAQGSVNRSWLWGPQHFGTLSEAYRESPGGRRTVQYWDKSRMEVTNPGANRQELWFVTNGLLTKELVSGKMQVGTSAMTQRQASQTPTVGDPTGQAARYSYASFAGVASLDGDRRAPVAVGAPVTQTIDERGTVSNDTAFGRYNVTIAEYNNELGHNIPGVFRSYLQSLPLDWVFVMGYPITEPYWTRATVGGQTKDVLVQLYERRTLTYTPSNGEAFRVEMGNVGQHYYRWRYGDAPWER